MSGAYLRAARSTDAGTVGAILSEFIDTTPWMPRIHTRAQDIAFAGHMIDRGWVSVVEDAGHVTGFSAREGVQVHALYVAASARRTGVGSALLNRFKTESDSLFLWTFQANLGAQAFYAAHGFAAVEQTDGAGNDEHLPDIRLHWSREAT